MGGFFGVISTQDSVLDVFFGVDYHSHLGVKSAGLAFYDPAKGFQRQIHSIENKPFRTKFKKDIESFQGNSGIGCISDSDPEPLIVRSHLGLYAIAFVGMINNAEELIETFYHKGRRQFMAMSSGKINSCELVAALINEKETFAEGIAYAQEVIEGSATIIILTQNAIITARDKMGRLPVLIGKNADGYCVSFESFAYQKLGYADFKELGPGEACEITAESVHELLPAGDAMKICAFLWVYYGYSNSNYEGQNVEMMRYRNGAIMAKDEMEIGSMPDVDCVAGVPDSGLPHAIGYANASKKPFARPFIKYTPTWSRSFLSANPNIRKRVATMKLIPVPELINGKKLLFVDDSIVRGTQLENTVDFLYKNGAKEVHMRSACPPFMFRCPYLGFSRATSEMELLTRRAVHELEGEEGEKHISEYSDANTCRGKAMLKSIAESMHFDSLRYQSLDGMLEAIGIPKENICTYCWTGKES